MKELSNIDSFFKTSTFKTNPESLAFQKVPFERMFFDSYSSLINIYKKNVPLEIPEDRSIKHSSWEPLLKSVHNGCIQTFSHFLPVINNRSESGILMDLFKILQLSGFGTYELGLPVPGSIMSISVLHSIDSFSDMALQMDPEKTFSAFSGGVVLACYNLAMASEPGIVDEGKAEEVYLNSPDIRQINNDCGDEEVIFVLSLEK